MPPRRAEDDRGLTLLDPDAMGEADRLAIAGGIPSQRLMENAGYAVADDISARHVQGTRVAVLCGPGNNGGDGFVVARVLKERGFIVRLALLGEVEALAGDAAAAAARFKGKVEPAVAEVLSDADVVVDALFGAGLSRELSGPAALLIDAANAARTRGAVIVAVDLPSGVDGRSGAILGRAIRATRTVTFFRRKPGHLLMPGREHAGRLIVADIGLPATVLGSIRSELFANEPALWADAWPIADAGHHKFSRGAALVASGPVYSSGAARLAAAAALHAGAGIVAVAAPPDAVPVVAAYRAAFVVKPSMGAADFGLLAADQRLKAMLAGPGLGVDNAAGDLMKAALRAPAALVVDADLVTVASRDPGAFFAQVHQRKAPVVLTPHEGEFSRLFPDLSEQRLTPTMEPMSKLDRAMAAATRSGAVVVLKGPDTIIAAPKGRAAINFNAPPSLATAGSGDVLAGIITGLMAADVPAFEAAAMGVWIHGRAGVIAGPGAIADDLLPALRRAMAEGPTAGD